MWEQVTITSVVHFHNCPHPAGITIAIFIALSSLQIVFLLSSKPVSLMVRLSCVQRASGGILSGTNLVMLCNLLFISQNEIEIEMLHL